jgi:putative hemolysin
VRSSYVLKGLSALDTPLILRDSADVLIFPGLDNHGYVVGLASSMRSVEEALRLRYRIFNLEMGEGLRSSEISGMDRDRFDDQMSHLVLIDKHSGEMVGTYRMQTVTRALAGEGIYSAQEYDLTALQPYFNQLIELGRACLTPEHRTVAAVLHMWQGIACYLLMNKCRYLFGCVSITSADPDDGWRALRTIRSRGWLHGDLFVPARPEYNCGALNRESDLALDGSVALPPLFRAYSKIGAKVISEPALDRDFGTIDFLMMLDGLEVKKSTLDVLNDTP